MSDTPTRFPLAWPLGRPRKSFTQRKGGKFTSGGRPITMSLALSRLADEIERLGGKNSLLSSNYEVRIDGTMVLNRGAPSDPGVCAYFSMGGKPYAMACDAYASAEQNVAAIAAHIEATRAIERHGVATAAETLQAFSALPPPVVTPPPVDWRKVFGLAPGAVMTEEEIGALYRIKAKARAGDDDALRDLNIARDLALGEVTAGGAARIGTS